MSGTEGNSRAMVGDDFRCKFFTLVKRNFWFAALFALNAFCLAVTNPSVRNAPLVINLPHRTRARPGKIYKWIGTE
jgi:hypothetical protein